MIRIRTSVTSAAYNLADPNEIQTMVSIRIFEDNSVIQRCHLTFDEDDASYWDMIMSDDPINGSKEAIKTYLNKILFSSQEKEIREILETINSFEHKLRLNWYKEEKENLLKKKEKIEKKLDEVNLRIERGTEDFINSQIPNFI